MVDPIVRLASVFAFAMVVASTLWFV